MHNYEKLIVWQKGMKLTELIYAETKIFPKDEIYGLTSQMRRSAVSIPSNIAEGSVRGSDNYFKQFLQISLGSASELSTQIKLASKFGYLNDKSTLEDLVSEVIKMLHVLIRNQKS